MIDPATFEVVRTIPSGTGSSGGTISPIHRRYFLPNADDNHLTVIDTQHDQLVALVPVGRGPREAILSATEDEVYVLNHDDASVSFIDANSTNAVRTVPTGSRLGIALGLNDYLMTLNDAGSSLDQRLITATALTPSETALATEYVDIARQRYLHTADGQEARLIADGLYGDEWRRTMHFFRVWTTQTDGRVPVCRFSSANDSGLSSVFAALPEECESLKANPSWTYEGVSYYVALPDSNGNCASGTEPLYRLHNNGQDGVAAHRYVREAGVRDTMANAGWTAEGNGAGVVYACVPALRASVPPQGTIDDTPEDPGLVHQAPRQRLR